MIKNILWDFDGVIAESVNVKTEAFYELYLGYGKDIADKVVEHHIANGGVSRFEKFKHYHRHFLNKEISEEEINNLAQKFSDIALKKVIDSPYIPGVIEFISSERKINHFIITGTPHNEMKEIATKRKIDKLFRSIMGSPKTKVEWINELVSMNEISISESVFIGDASTDYNAALSTKMKFVLREVDYNVDLFKNYAGPRVKDFLDFKTVIEAL